jgi:hypothetical protein
MPVGNYVVRKVSTRKRNAKGVKVPAETIDVLREEVPVQRGGGGEGLSDKLSFNACRPACCLINPVKLNF